MLTIETKYDADDADDAYCLYKQFVAFVCNWCTIASLTDYANNPTYQDMTKADKYLGSDEKMNLDLRRSKGYANELESLTRDDTTLTLTSTLEEVVTKKMTLMLIGIPKTPSSNEGQLYNIQTME